MAKHNLLISSQRHCSNRETIKAKRTACEFDTQPWPNLTSPSTRSDATKTILQQQDSPGHWGAPKAGSAKESTNLQMQNHAKPHSTLLSLQIFINGQNTVNWPYCPTATWVFPFHCDQLRTHLQLAAGSTRTNQAYVCTTLHSSHRQGC